MQAAVRKLPQLTPEPRDYLGPAEVIAVEPTAVTVELPDEQAMCAVRAELAFALPYAPVVGDLLLVIAKDDACYAIGVLRGSGKTSLSLQGDVDLHAEGGTLRLSGDRGIELRGPELDLHAGKLRMVADAVLQNFSSVCQRVKSLLHVHAGETHTLVDGGTFAQSKSAAILTEETVTINGKEIHLG
jgi:Protein of unknown function (DUF3540)